MSNKHSKNEIKRQMPLMLYIEVGDRIRLYDVKEDARGNIFRDKTFEGTVSRNVPDTGLLRFDGEDAGKAEFLQSVDESDGFEIINGA